MQRWLDCTNVASKNGHTAVTTLINSNAHVNIQEEDGLTALMVASQNGHSETVTTLINYNAHVNVQSKNGWTAVMAASQNGHSETVAIYSSTLMLMSTFKRKLAGLH